MKDNAKRVLIAVLCVCLAGALIWAIAGQIAQSRYKLRLKSMYERSYYSFVGGMDELEVNLSKRPNRRCCCSAAFPGLRRTPAGRWPP